MKKIILFIAGGLLFSAGSANAQCSFTGLNSIYCEGDAVSTLVPSGTGMIVGNGIVGNDFDPAVAGIGTHQITYWEKDPNSYTVDQTGTYAPVAGTGTSVTLSDDQTSAALPIGFTFNFFGLDYTQFYISSNGFLGFTSGMSQGCCSGGTIPTAGNPDNYIAFSWDDMYPPGAGSIQYFVTGTSPYQALVVNFYDIPFCCNSTSVVKTQIIMYETTGVIEIHTEYANGVSPGTMGIENVDGTIGFPVPGRNSQAWPSLVNDYVAFFPDTLCSDIQMVEVAALPVVTGTVDLSTICAGDSVVFTGAGADSAYVWDNGAVDGMPTAPTATGDYTVIGYDSTGCSNTAIVSIVVNPAPSIVLTSGDEILGADGSATGVTSGGTSPYTYDWDNDGTGDFDDTESLTGLAAGTYVVTVMDDNGCTFTDSVIVGSQVGLEDLSGIEFSIHPNPSTGEFQVTLASETIGDNVSFQVVNSLGQIITSEQITSNVINVNISGNEAGVYFVKVISDKGASVKSIILK